MSSIRHLARILSLTLFSLSATVGTDSRADGLPQGTCEALRREQATLSQERAMLLKDIEKNKPRLTVIIPRLNRLNIAINTSPECNPGGYREVCRHALEQAQKCSDLADDPRAGFTCGMPTTRLLFQRCNELKGK